MGSDPLSQRCLKLSKHEGAGNDFLVLVDLSREISVTQDLVRGLCHRNFGIGADGLMRVSKGSDQAEISMELWNADGSIAEMSGNGIRCLAQGACDAGLVTPPTFRVSTLAGIRTIEYSPHGAPDSGDWAEVDMGAVALREAIDPPPGFVKARRANVGNPHLVILCDESQSTDPSDLVGLVALDSLGGALDQNTPGGVNVEFIAPRGSEITIRTWERGAGATLACGTGSCAAAEVACSWGLVGTSVVVHNPGGDVEVKLGAVPGETVHLGGPVHRIAEITVDVDELSHLGIRPGGRL